MWHQLIYFVNECFCRYVDQTPQTNNQSVVFKHVGRRRDGRDYKCHVFGKDGQQPALLQTVTLEVRGTGSNIIHFAS